MSCKYCTAKEIKSGSAHCTVYTCSSPYYGGGYSNRRVDELKYVYCFGNPYICPYVSQSNRLDEKINRCHMARQKKASKNFLVVLIVICLVIYAAAKQLLG